MSCNTFQVRVQKKDFSSKNMKKERWKKKQKSRIKQNTKTLSERKSRVACHVITCQRRCSRKQRGSKAVRRGGRILPERQRHAHNSARSFFPNQNAVLTCLPNICSHPCAFCTACLAHPGSQMRAGNRHSPVSIQSSFWSHLLSKAAKI